jgi:mitogen-activated protein kinase 1/3
VIGTPTDEELGFIRNEDARKYMRHLPQFPRRPFASMFPRVQPVALVLIERMLTFNPLQRRFLSFLFFSPCATRAAAES